MAYNPFNIFRRNQKAIFAVVTVIIMFAFVMSSGLGGGADFFDWLPRWLGKSSQKGDVVCKLDGDKVYDSELRKLSFQRVMANKFMRMAASEAVSGLSQYITQQLALVTDPETKRLLKDGPQAIEELQSPRSQMMRANRSFLNSIPQLAMQFKQLEDTAAAYTALASSPTAKPLEREIIRARQYEMAITRQFMRSRELYFSNALNRNQTDLINFMLWQKKADQLGINFSAADVNQLIQKEFYGFFRSDVPVRKEMQREMQNNFTLESCLRAIAEEFRVRTAQEVVLGSGLIYPGGEKLGDASIFGTPFEMFEFYRDKCSPTEYEAIPVPVAGFLDKVTGEPTDDELKRLYDQYKDDEPNPGRETPGFKTPRRIKVEWISGSGSEPYYKKLAEESLKAGELQAKIGSLLTVPFPGVGPGWVLAATTPLVPKDLLLSIDSVRTEYNNSTFEHHFNSIKNHWNMPDFVPELLDTSVVRPQTLVAALAGTAGGSLTMAGPLSGVSTLETAARAFELRDRILVGAPGVLGSIPGPSMFATLIGGDATMRTVLPKPLSIETVKAELLNHLTEQTARQLLLADFKTFAVKVAELSGRFNLNDLALAALKNGKVPEAVVSKLDSLKNKELTGETFAAELKKLLSPDELKQYQSQILKQAELPQNGVVKDKAAVLKYIGDYIAPRGWQHGASTKLESEWTLEDDPGLSALRGILDKAHRGNQRVRFGQKFFWTDEAMGAPKAPVTGLFKPEYYPNAPNQFESPAMKPEPVFMVWRTEETRSQPAPSFLAAKDLARAAWKRMKARELAMKRAEWLANAIRGSAGDVPELINQNMRELANELRNEIADPKVKDRIQVFPINGVAPLAGDDRSGYHPYVLQESSNIPYPTKAMTDTLLDERTQPPKTTFILTDSPKDTYYVVTLKQRDLKKVEEFNQWIYSDIFSSLGGPSAMSQTRQMIIGAFLEDAQKKTLDSVLGLLKQEFKYEITDEQKKNLEKSNKEEITP